MAEETTVTTNGVETTPATTEPATTVETNPTTNGEGAGTTATTPAETTPENGADGAGVETTTSAVDSFTISDIEWPDELGLDDAGKETLFNENKDLFKGKTEVNAYLKKLAEATKINKENQAKKAQELEAKWEQTLKTDSEFGKDYEGNKKLVIDTMKKFSNEADYAELEKFGFVKSPALNKLMLKIAKEFEGAKVIKAGQSPAPSQEPKKDSYGRTMFDFTQKQ